VAGIEFTLIVAELDFPGRGCDVKLGLRRNQAGFGCGNCAGVDFNLSFMRSDRQKMFIYYTTAYWMGLIGSLPAQALQ
jgi:hypothetical protein